MALRATRQNRGRAGVFPVSGAKLTRYRGSISCASVPTSRKRSAGKSRVEHHALAAKLRPNAAQNAPIRVFSGYPGPSSNPDVIRLYTSHQFDEYLEIGEDELLHVETIPGPTPALSFTAIWVPGTATLTHSRSQTRSAPAAFLRGPISEAYMSDAIGSTGTFNGPFGTFPSVTSVGCVSESQHTCPSDHCPSHDNCPTPCTAPYHSGKG
jgi:hypothetical protein